MRVKRAFVLAGTSGALILTGVAAPSVASASETDQPYSHGYAYCDEAEEAKAKHEEAKAKHEEAKAKYEEAKAKYEEAKADDCDKDNGDHDYDHDDKDNGDHDHDHDGKDKGGK